MLSLCKKMSGIYWKVSFFLFLFHIYLSLKYSQAKPSVALNASKWNRSSRRYIGRALFCRRQDPATLVIAGETDRQLKVAVAFETLTTQYVLFHLVSHTSRLKRVHFFFFFFLHIPSVLATYRQSESRDSEAFNRSCFICRITIYYYCHFTVDVKF